MNRKTFYYHFEDIYALLHWMLQEEAIEVVRNFDLLVDYEDAIIFVVDYIENGFFPIILFRDAANVLFVCREMSSRFIYMPPTVALSVLIISAYPLLFQPSRPDKCPVFVVEAGHQTAPV